MPNKTARLLTAVALVLLTAFAIYRQGRVAAADSDSTTWGAADPSWSPDGKRLAISLFGSIWMVPVDGGEAVQLTTSAGYHAHPAWSPKGDSIAFVSGLNPAGRIPNIPGRLAVVDANTGVEREIATNDTVASTLTWSPDGTRIVCGLRTPQDSLLHEIEVASGKARQIHFAHQRSGATLWTSVSWGADNELYFISSQRGENQVWTLPTGGNPMVIQLPLTSYRKGDIAQLHSVSAIPAGGAIFSAAIVNGKGDHELYRVPRNGGKPVAVTNTPLDEFSPAVSPDGKWIAHVSNHLGNMDVFVMPIGGGAKKHVRISGLKFRKPSGRVRVNVVDETGAPTRVRLYVTASDGKAYVPAGSQVFYQPFERGRRDGFFLSSGSDEFPAPSGRLRLTALKGVEYKITDQNIDVPDGSTATVTLRMERWTNWLQRGWYTGENHFHANYNGTYYQRPPDSMAWLQSEDLNTANMIVANSEGAFIHDKEFFTGGVSPLSTPRYILYWGQEYRNSDPLGHMAFLNIKKQVPPSYTSVVGSNASYDFPLNTMAALEAKKQGGLVSSVHPIGGQLNDVFDTMLGAKETSVTAALGALDAIDILPYGRAAYNLWYSFLNSGFRISPGAGTDVFTNWRGINNIPGGSRQYVETGTSPGWQRYVERFAAGRAFATNGPLLTFTVNGNPMGSVVNVPKGQPYTARLSADFSARFPLGQADIIQNGRVIESRDAAGANTLHIDKEVTVNRSTWFAVRITGPVAQGVVNGIPHAHSGVVYIHIGSEPVLVKSDVELMLRWTDRQWRYLEERDNFGPAPNRAAARKIFDQAMAHYRAKLAKAAD